jgi:hypothetical protein
MSPRKRLQWLALVAGLSFGCAHPRAQQTDARPPSSAVGPQSAATPAVPAASPDSSTAAASSTSAAAAANEPSTATASADFARDVRPILEKRCQPCHFPGGKMYERLPFDRPETIRTLGTRLFTRIKAEDEQAVIRRFLAAGS